MDQDYIFIHIPRTGGRSIYSKLGLSFPGDHFPISYFIKEYTEPVVRNKFKFTTVRNPFDRFVSLWKLYVLFIYSPRPDKYILTFEEWLKQKYDNTKGMDDAGWYMDQMWYCKNEKGEILIDKFIKFENLEEDFLSISSRFNIFSKQLPHIGHDDKPQETNTIKETVERRLNEAIGNAIITETDKQKILERIPNVGIKNYRDIYESQRCIDIAADMSREMINLFGYHF